MTLGGLEKFCSCLLSAEERAQKQNSAAIDYELKKQKVEMDRELKLLLLGTGESGKSTFIKQMKIIHGLGFSPEDQDMFRGVIKSNMLNSMKNILSAMDMLYIQHEHEANMIHRKLIKSLHIEEGRDQLHLDAIERLFTNKVAEALSVLWQDSGVQRCYDRRREYQLTDSAKYFFDSLNDIVQPDYSPSEQDILRSRIPTEGIYEYVFRLERVDFRIIDVGGQRKERRKWIQCFEHVTSIIFLSALSEYDLVLQESATQNRMEESLHLFRTIICYPWFQRASIIIFLNKTDVFEEKIRYSRLTDYFPQYSGDIHDSFEAREFILQLFKESAAVTATEVDPPKPIYSHFTCATDTQNIKFVFNSVRDHILHTHLREFNLV